MKIYYPILLALTLGGCMEQNLDATKNNIYYSSDFKPWPKSPSVPFENEPCVLKPDITKSPEMGEEQGFFKRGGGKEVEEQLNPKCMLQAYGIEKIKITKESDPVSAYTYAGYLFKFKGCTEFTEISRLLKYSFEQKIKSENKELENTYRVPESGYVLEVLGQKCAPEGTISIYDKYGAIAVSRGLKLSEGLI